MLNLDEQSAVMEKTRELCQAILQQPAVASAREAIAAFMENEAAHADYQALIGKGQALQEKQERSLPLSEQEIADFESHREKVLGNPVAKAFLDAQQAVQEVRHSVNKFVSMSLETGKVPTVEDFQAATCGQGCHCH
jgi:cell fate (sporulation/competence/biofilm development) regulator YlbF (YheA/YmcA/DUF963 family)